MRHPRLAHLGFVLVLLAAGCSEGGLTTEPHHPADALHSLSDGAHGGIEGFYFLPPMVKKPGYGGTFDAALQPVVEICETTACDVLHASYSMTENGGSEVVRVEESDEHYIVNWHTGQTGAASGQIYRVRVVVNKVVLGYAEVTVVSTGREAVEVRSDGSIALVANQTLPVKFRIETGIVLDPIAWTITLDPPEASLHVGESQQFTATVFADGVEVTDPVTLGWSSSSGAEVDQDGLATALEPGLAVISVFLLDGSEVMADAIAELTVLDPIAWNAWHALATEVDNTVWSLTVYDGDLIAGGDFTTAGGEPTNYVARWGGTEWQPMGEGMNNVIRVLTVQGGDLIAGGFFTTAGGEMTNRIARWDGTAWQPIGTGMNDWVLSLTVYDDDLIAGGSFTSASGKAANRVARWDGTEWQPMGTGMNDEVWSLTVHNGELIASGRFTTAGGAPANRVARWDGSTWQPMGIGMDNIVARLSVYGGDLIAGGSFTTASGQTADRVARWDGSMWQPMGTGMNSVVRSFTVHDGDLIAGGHFTTASGEAANRVARWDGSMWQPIGTGMNSAVLSLTVYDGDLIASGFFTAASEQTANYIARWGTP